MGWFSDIVGDDIGNFVGDLVSPGSLRDIATTVALGPMLGPVYATGRAMQAQQNKAQRQMNAMLEALRPPATPQLQAPVAPMTRRNGGPAAATGGAFTPSPYSTILTSPSGVLPSATLLGKNMLLGA